MVPPPPSQVFGPSAHADAIRRPSPIRPPLGPIHGVPPTQSSADPVDPTGARPGPAALIRTVLERMPNPLQFLSAPRPPIVLSGESTGLDRSVITQALSHEIQAGIGHVLHRWVGLSESELSRHPVLQAYTTQWCQSMGLHHDCVPSVVPLIAWVVARRINQMYGVVVAPPAIPSPPTATQTDCPMSLDHNPSPSPLICASQPSLTEEIETVPDSQVAVIPEDTVAPENAPVLVPVDSDVVEPPVEPEPQPAPTRKSTQPKKKTPKTVPLETPSPNPASDTVVSDTKTGRKRARSTPRHPPKTDPIQSDPTEIVSISESSNPPKPVVTKPRKSKKTKTQTDPILIPSPDTAAATVSV